MPRVIEKTVYEFNELSERAKETARDYYRNHCCNDWEPEFSGFEELAKCLGIEFNARAVRLMSGKDRYDPDISYSIGDRGEFCSYSGSWSVKSDALVKFKELGWTDEDLLGIAETLTRASLYCQLVGLPTFSARVRTTRRDDSSMWVGFDEGDEDEDGEPTPLLPKDMLEAIETALTGFASWMLKSMRDDYEYQYSDECVDQYLEELEFDSDGALSRE